MTAKVSSKGTHWVYIIMIILLDGNVLHEGWAVKESGTALFGKTNWRKRWFRLVQNGDSSTFEYYKYIPLINTIVYWVYIIIIEIREINYQQVMYG